MRSSTLRVQQTNKSSLILLFGMISQVAKEQHSMTPSQTTAKMMVPP